MWTNLFGNGNSGLTKDSSINPKEKAEYSKKAGYYDKDYAMGFKMGTYD